MYELRPLQPYNFELSLKRLQDLPKQVVARVEGGVAYVRALQQGARLGLVRVRPAGEALAVEIEGDLEPEITLAQVRKAFSLDVDLVAFQRHMEQADPVMAGLGRMYSGARPIQAFDLWEALVWIIIGQQVNVRFAYQLKESLVRMGAQSYGGLPAFPGPGIVAAWQYEELQAEKFTRKKAEYIIDFARALTEGSLDLQSLVSQPFDKAVADLVKLRGIGRWTAECLLMDAGHPNAFPADDIGIRNAVQRFYGLDHQPTEAEVRELGRPWAPYCSLACYYLWLGLRDHRERGL